MLGLTFDNLRPKDSLLPGTAHQQTHEEREKLPVIPQGIQTGEERINASVVSISPQATQLNFSSMVFFGASMAKLSETAELANRMYLKGVISEDEFTILAGREAETIASDGVLGESLRTLDNTMQVIGKETEPLEQLQALQKIKTILEDLKKFGGTIKNPQTLASLKQFNSLVGKMSGHMDDTAYTNIHTLLKMSDRLATENRSTMPVKRYMEVFQQ